MEPTLRCEVITWGEVCRLARKVARQIHASGFQPDIVVAIARGGYVPARLLCDHLELYDLVSLRVAHYTGAEKIGQARIVTPLGVELKDRNVLLVDDVSDSGDTLQLVLEHIRTHSPRELRLAVLHHKQCSALVPDFYARRVTVWRWITYPWALVEDLSGFVRRMQPPPASIEEAAARLQREYLIRVPRQVIEDVFALFEAQHR